MEGDVFDFKWSFMILLSSNKRVTRLSWKSESLNDTKIKKKILFYLNKKVREMYCALYIH